MKLLLTSAGVSNPTISAALVALLGKPIDQCQAICIPTAMYGHPHAGPGVGAWEFVAGRSQQPMTELGWRSVGLLELTALPSIARERWQSLVEQADVILASGGDAVYLAHWMKASGMADLIDQLPNGVWVGMSAGSMVMTPRIGEDFVGWEAPEGRSDLTLGQVGFSIFPHVDHPKLPENTMAAAESWASTLDNPAYAIDDQTAISVVNGHVEVHSEGAWQKLR